MQFDIFIIYYIISYIFIMIFIFLTHLICKISQCWEYNIFWYM